MSFYPTRSRRYGIATSMPLTMPVPEIAPSELSTHIEDDQNEISQQSSPSPLRHGMHLILYIIKNSLILVALENEENIHVELPPSFPLMVPPPTPVVALASHPLLAPQTPPLPPTPQKSFSSQKQRARQRRARKEYVRVRRGKKRAERATSVGEGRITILDHRGGVINVGNNCPSQIGNCSFIIGSHTVD